MTKDVAMQPLTDSDYEVIEAAQKAIQRNYDAIHDNHTVGAAVQRNYDAIHDNHTVGAAVRCKSGKIYAGVNVYSIHGACAEQIAIGTAITQGEREFETVVAVMGKDGAQIIPPCGNCRQIMYEYMPECDVILSVDGQNRKIKAKELLPFPYYSEE